MASLTSPNHPFYSRLPTAVVEKFISFARTHEAGQAVARRTLSKTSSGSNSSDSYNTTTKSSGSRESKSTDPSEDEVPITPNSPPHPSPPPNARRAKFLFVGKDAAAEAAAAAITPATPIQTKETMPLHPVCLIPGSPTKRRGTVRALRVLLFERADSGPYPSALEHVPTKTLTRCGAESSFDFELSIGDEKGGGMEGEEDMIHMNGGLDFDDEKDDCDQEKKEFEAWLEATRTSSIRDLTSDPVTDYFSDPQRPSTLVPSLLKKCDFDVELALPPPIHTHTQPLSAPVAPPILNTFEASLAQRLERIDSEAKVLTSLRWVRDCEVEAGGQYEAETGAIRGPGLRDDSGEEGQTRRGRKHAQELAGGCTIGHSEARGESESLFDPGTDESGRSESNEADAGLDTPPATSISAGSMFKDDSDEEPIANKYLYAAVARALKRKKVTSVQETKEEIDGLPVSGSQFDILGHLTGLNEQSNPS